MNAINFVCACFSVQVFKADGSLDCRDVWTPELEQHTTYTYEEIFPVVKRIAKILMKVKNLKNQVRNVLFLVLHKTLWMKLKIPQESTVTTFFVSGQGVCGQGVVYRQGECGWGCTQRGMYTEMATEAGGTHHTGMYSCDSYTFRHVTRSTSGRSTTVSAPGSCLVSLHHR